MLNHIDLCEYPEANRIGREDTFFLLPEKKEENFPEVGGEHELKSRKTSTQFVLKRHDYGILKCRKSSNSSGSFACRLV